MSRALYKAELFLYKSSRPKVFFRFEIIINAFVSSSRFIRIPMLWVYGHYKYFDFFRVGTLTANYEMQWPT